MNERLVRDYMSRHVETARSYEPLRSALERMAARRCSCTVICKDARPVGIVTERDLASIVLHEASASHLAAPVSESMTRGIVAVEETATVAKAARVLRDRSIRRVPVVDEKGAICGILTQSDLLRAYVTQANERSEQLEVLVAKRTRELQDANERLEALSLTDGLLGIGNRRAMEVHLTNLHQIAARYAKCYAVAMLDVDAFKLYNDNYGHLAADGVLKQLASTTTALLRAPDRAFRYGGEEVVVVLPETGLDGALQAAERIRGGIEALGIEHVGGPAGVVTVSIGVSVARDDEKGLPDSWCEVVDRADNALYEAKQGGRNRVVCFGAAATPQSRC